MPHEVPGQCPVCGETMEVTRLHCPSCHTTIEGKFAPSRFARLGREQLQFLEAFLRSRGVIKDVEEELGISYPTVRGRLDELLRTLGLTDDKERRRTVLADLSAGRITSEQAMAMLKGGS